MNIDHLFYVLQKDGKISRKEILRLIDEDYLEYLIEQKILKPTDSYDYSIDDVEKAFYFGRYFLQEKQYQIANRIFDCCYKTEPDNFVVNYQLFYRSLFSRKKREIYKHLNVVYSYLEKTERKQDANFYLLLVGYLYGPDDNYIELKEKFNNLVLEDILIPYDSEDFDMDENDLRAYTFEKKYSKVTQYTDYQYENKELSFEEGLEKELLIEVLVHTRKVGRLIKEFIKKDELYKLKELLDEEIDKKSLRMTDEYVYILLNKYLEIEETGIVPEIRNTNTKTTFHAITNNDFKKALKLMQEYTSARDFESMSSLHIMLEKINYLIDNRDKEKPVEIKKEVKSFGISTKDKNMIDDMINLLRNGRAVVLLEPMPKEKRDLIHEYIRSCSDVASYSIGENDERRIVLRYRPIVPDYININEVSRSARECVRNKKYEEAVKYYQKLLRIGHPRVKTYGEYGIALLKLHRIEEAVDALKIATILSKEKNLGLDYTEIIEGILNRSTSEDYKKRVEIEEDEFNDNKYVNLDSNFINDLIGLMNENEITLEDACTKLNLNEEQINYVKLICARDYYYLNDQRRGDQLLKEVVKSKAKNKEIKKLINEINASKKYYSNRLDNEKSQLVFKKK